MSFDLAIRNTALSLYKMASPVTQTEPKVSQLPKSDLEMPSAHPPSLNYRFKGTFAEIVDQQFAPRYQTMLEKFVSETSQASEITGKVTAALKQVLSEHWDTKNEMGLRLRISQLSSSFGKTSSHGYAGSIVATVLEGQIVTEGRAYKSFQIDMLGNIYQ